MRARGLIVAAALLSPPGLAATPPAGPAGRPVTFPTRDVEIAYAVLGVADPEHLTVLAARGWQRVDAPGGALSVVTESAARRMIVIDHDHRTYTILPTAGVVPDPLGRLGALTEVGRSSQAGVPCTEWRGEAQADDVTACLTADGDLLRLSVGPETLVRAVSVAHDPPDPALFEPPAGYRRTAVAPAPAPGDPGK